ncbi:MAG TPA: FHA domain-containing protein [Verrucomicrobiae bacterium]|nr:FHA domain-containing protein [Verrucomicrobiae bacterium]
MIQLNILSGKKADSQWIVRHFPFRIGRAEQNDLQLEDVGIWNQHLTLEFQKKTGFNLTTAPNALTSINGEPAQTRTLRNGDIITIGSIKIQFWLTAVAQRGLQLREMFVWLLIMLVTIGQFFLIYWLLR